MTLVTALRKYSTIFLLLFLCSCSFDEWMKERDQEQDSRFAKAFLLKFAQGDFEFVRQNSSDRMAPTLTLEFFTKFDEYMPRGGVIDITLYRADTFQFSTYRSIMLYELEFEDGWVMATVDLHKGEKSFVVDAVNFTRFEASQSELNSFKLTGKSFWGFCILLASVLVPMFVIFTLIDCIRNRALSRKVLWAIFILLGFGSVTVNWTTDEISIRFITFYLLSAAVSVGGKYGPWIFTVSFPLGAIAYWIRKLDFEETKQKLTSDSEKT